MNFEAKSHYKVKWLAVFGATELKLYLAYFTYFVIAYLLSVFDKLEAYFSTFR